MDTNITRIPAPWNGKDLTTDWDWLFDFFDCVENPTTKTVLGFVKDSPVIMTYHENVLTFQLQAERYSVVCNEIAERIKEVENENADLTFEHERNPENHTLKIYSYFEIL